LSREKINNYISSQRGCVQKRRGRSVGYVKRRGTHLTVSRDRARDRMSGQPERSASHVSIDQCLHVMSSPGEGGFRYTNMSGQREVEVNCIMCQTLMHSDSVRASTLTSQHRHSLVHRTQPNQQRDSATVWSNSKSLIINVTSMNFSN